VIRCSRRSSRASPGRSAVTKTGEISDDTSGENTGATHKREVAAAKAFFRLAFRRQGRLPLKITLYGYQASHRAAKEALDEHPEGNQCKIRSSKYLNNLIEQDHRSVKLRLGPMLGLKHFRQAATTIAGIELMHRIRKGQFKLGRLGTKGNTAPKIWNAVLAA
jgi:transposase-like protein